ncbi:MAG TPA: hypothetical protein VKT71_10995 [Candidatus Acidoferrales bacterium]|nr:hypothetical protein [Candidatus Acidoferrales bacterium]
MSYVQQQSVAYTVLLATRRFFTAHEKNWPRFPEEIRGIAGQLLRIKNDRQRLKP